MANHEIARLETKGQKLQLGAGQDRGHSTARPVRAVGITLLMGYFFSAKRESIIHVPRRRAATQSMGNA